ncbi:hypothetical protein MNBD_ALPHA11-903 [hydrothermal vent metagenome]|uniref:Uncharacterized protein n=1 Tax=hydrothermal vent metagenome TaxID=652676 RepID=A0A3B0UF00_9ZZZZ
MKKIATTSLTVLALVLAATVTGQARSPDNLVSNSQLDAFCADKSPNAKVPVQFTDASGQVIEGIIECEYASANRRDNRNDRYDNDRYDDDRHDDDRYDDRHDDDHDDDRYDDDRDDDRYDDDHDDDRYERRGDRS